MSTIFPLIFTVSHHVFHNIRDKKANIEIMFFYKMQKKTDMAIPLKSEKHIQQLCKVIMGENY